MTNSHTPPLSDTDKKLLSFLQSGDRYLYGFLDESLFPTYAEATSTMSRLILHGWVTTGWLEGSISYRLTELGHKCLETGLQLEAIPEPERPKFFWQYRPN